VKAQTTPVKDPVSLIAGIGNYEYLHAGVHIPFSGNHYFETGAGIKPWNFKSEFYASTFLGAGFPLFNSDKSFLFKTIHQAKVFFWYFNNEYNRFVFFGLGPEARIVYSLSRRMNLCGSFGAVYNFQIYYERKTYEEVGFPKELQPSFSFQIQFALK
jgi:hypothetical protein